MVRAWGRVAIFGVLCLIAGCSEPPTKERDQAVAAIAAARTAGAATYAADELAAADASLKRYDDFVTQRDYQQALSTALDARDRGFEAAKAAAAKQQALRVEADRLLRSLEAQLVVVDARLKATHPRTQARLVDKLRQTRKATATAMQEARKELSAGELSAATRRLVGASTALKRDNDALGDAAKKPTQ